MTRRVVWITATLALSIAIGCSSTKREPKTEAQLLQERNDLAKTEAVETRELITEFNKHLKAEQDEYKAGKRPDAPVIDFLVISGGGDWGAFGAGFLKGWGKVPKSDPLARPQFDIVSGVSTGALIAPFAYLGDDESIERINHLYRNPKPDWVKQRWPLYFLPNNLSLAEVPGLERELKENISPEMVAQLAAANKQQRVLVVNTTNLDDASPRVWNLGTEAERAQQSGDSSRLYNILLASAGIPGAFPYREIDGHMYVDGGVTGNIIFGGRLSEEDSLAAIWQKTYPDTALPKIRYWVIFNNQLQDPPEVVKARWLDIITRSMELSTRSATLTSMRQLKAMAEIARLKRHADIEIRIVAVPNDWLPPKEGVFVKEVMNNLADVGEKMGAQTSSWMVDKP